LPDRGVSRAVLIGTSEYHHAGLNALPAVKRNLTHLHAVLTDPVGGILPTAHCAKADEPDTTAGIGRVLARYADEATDLLLVYYSGHGLVDESGRLHLAVTDTDPDPARLRYSALPFDTLRETLVAAGATVCVLLLDCCFSGRAIEAMSDDDGVITGQLGIKGTYTITSTTANATSSAPPGAAHTAFTEALLGALRKPEPLTLDDMFRCMDRDLRSRAAPRPQRRVVDTPGDLPLSRGRPERSPSPAGVMTPDETRSPDLSRRALSPRTLGRREFVTMTTATGLMAGGACGP
jgi:hypothetical protein